MKRPEVSVVFPVLNEEDTIKTVIDKARNMFKVHDIDGEVVVADNGSTDRSVAIAKKAGARVVHEERKGYGNAYHRGFAEARGKYFVMADADDTYDLLQIQEFIQPLREGYDFVIGNRFKGTIHKGAMPWHHKYIGNPVLSGILRIMFRTSIGDSHCGMRAFTREAFKKMRLHTSGMEFASEMVIRAVEAKLKIKEIPTNLYPRKGGTPKLHSFRDGWRHLRFMFTYSPLWLFIIPGTILLLMGVVGMLALLPGPITINGVMFSLHPMLIAAALIILGYQTIISGLYTRVYRWKTLDIEIEHSDYITKNFTGDRGLIAGMLIFLAGFILDISLFTKWYVGDYNQLASIRWALVGLVLMVVGIQTAFSSFFLSILQIEKR